MNGKADELQSVCVGVLVPSLNYAALYSVVELTATGTKHAVSIPVSTSKNDSLELPVRKTDHTFVGLVLYITSERLCCTMLYKIGYSSVPVPPLHAQKLVLYCLQVRPHRSPTRMHPPSAITESTGFQFSPRKLKSDESSSPSYTTCAINIWFHTSICDTLCSCISDVDQNISSPAQLLLALELLNFQQFSLTSLPPNPPYTTLTLLVRSALWYPMRRRRLFLHKEHLPSSQLETLSPVTTSVLITLLTPAQ